MNAIETASRPTQMFNWGRIKWQISKPSIPETEITVGDVVILPGRGHDRHQHRESDEVLYVLAGRGEQTVGDDDPFAVSTGDVIHVPRQVMHSTRNTGWTVLHLLVIYSPAGAEEALRGAPDFREIPAGVIPPMENA